MQTWKFEISKCATDGAPAEVVMKATILANSEQEAREGIDKMTFELSKMGVGLPEENTIRNISLLELVK